MTEHNFFYYPYASFTNAQLPQLKVAALYFDKMVSLDLVGTGAAQDVADIKRGLGAKESETTGGYDHE